MSVFMVKRTGVTKTWKQRSITASMCGLAVVAGLVATPSIAKADDAAAVLSKMINMYKSAKVYSAVVVTKQAGKTKDSKAFSMTKTESIKYKSPNLIMVVTTFDGDGAAKGKVTQNNQTVAGDGKMLTAYNVFQNKYVKKPDLPSITLMDILDILKRIPTAAAKNISSLPGSSINGRAVSVVQISPVMNPKLSPEDQKKWKAAVKNASPLKLYVDAQNSSLLRISEAANGNSIDVTFKDQLFNGNIPPAVFNFTPPKGSTEMKTPAPGAPGTRPMAPAPAKK